VRIGSLPSDLVALFELSSLEKDPERAVGALRLYRGLVESKWQLEKSSYAFYAEEIRPWIPSSAETTELARREKQKWALSSAAEDFIEKPRSLLFKDGS